MSGIIRVIVH